MPWITRTLESELIAPQLGLRLFPVWLILGPRQVGKSSLLAHCSSPDRKRFSLDHIETRNRARNSPEYFARELNPPFLVDEIQYVPSVIESLKVVVDQAVLAGHAHPGLAWLTGSQGFELMRGMKETLAGRVAIIHLHGLSDEEKGASTSPDQVFRSVMETSLPVLHGVSDPNARSLFLDSYVQTYLERDVALIAQLRRLDEFQTFVRLASLRTGQEIEPSVLGQEASVSAPTAREWLSILEGSLLVRRIPPWFSNRSKRLTKKAKYIWLDAGLAAWLGGWRDPETTRLGPLGGALFESHVIGQIIRFFSHRVIPFQLHFLRTRDGVEIDLLLEVYGSIWPIEIKMGVPDPRSLARMVPYREDNWRSGMVVSLASELATPVPFAQEWNLVGYGGLIDWLRSLADLGHD